MISDQTNSKRWITSSLSLRLFTVFCIAVYSLAGATQWHTVIIHDHAETYWEMQHDHHTHSEGGDVHHEDPHDKHSGDENEHHHHFACYSSVALATVDTCNYSFFRQVMKYDLLSHNEGHPTEPTFKIIKPPQVA